MRMQCARYLLAVLSGILLCSAASPVHGQSSPGPSSSTSFPSNPEAWVNSGPISTESLKGKAAFIWFYEDGEAWSGTIDLSILKDQVSGLGRIRIEVRPKEQCHSVAHFHVVGTDFDGSYRIPDCLQLAGKIPNRAIRKFLERISGEKNTLKILVDEWNNTRPTDCPICRLPKLPRFR